MISDQDYAKQDYVYAIGGTSEQWRARFIDGVFTPEPCCAGNLNSQVVRQSAIMSVVSNWCGHGSTFTWNPDQECWDEFDVSQGRVTCQWKRAVEFNNYPLYAINGDPNNGWKAQFIDGKFTPHPSVQHNLKSEVIRHSSTLSIVPNWCGHGSLFIYNSDNQAWDEYDVSQGKVTCTWKVLG